MPQISRPYNPLDEFEQVNPATMLESPESVPNNQFTAEQRERGRYLVTPAGLRFLPHQWRTGLDNPEPINCWLVSDWGIAYTNPPAGN